MTAQGTIIVYSEERVESHASAEVHTPHIASTLLDEGFYADAATMEEALQHAVQVCLYLGVPVARHFRPIHVHGAGGHEQDDWALSDLAFYLLLLNGKRQSAQRAFAQAWIIRRAFAGQR